MMLRNILKGNLDIDLLLSQVLTWMVMISYIALIYVIVLAAVTLPFGITPENYAPPWWINLLAFVVIAAAFLPVYRWVRGSVQELIYSQQDTSHPALTRLNRYLESSPSPNDILPTIAETFARALKLPFVEIEIQPPHLKRAGESVAPGKGQPVTYGKTAKDAPLERIPLSYHEFSIGEMRVSGRRGNEPLSQSDRDLLYHLAQQVGIALYAAQLTEDLQRSRERLVVTREEERRRIRNDLHDGLAPTLSSIQLQLGAARNLIHRDPEQAEAMINEMREDMRDATAEIRQMVYDLRPPMLDDLGLIGAIQNSKFEGSDVHIQVIAPEHMPKLSAAVEVAVYRIASEALHNVVKHAQATACQISIEIDGGCLVLKVTDDGKSIPVDFKAGVGLNSMKERASELGGTLMITPNAPSGTCVFARIPLETGCMEV